MAWDLNRAAVLESRAVRGGASIIDVLRRSVSTPVCASPPNPICLRNGIIDDQSQRLLRQASGVPLGCPVGTRAVSIRLGLVGGVGWETTGLYQRVLNVRVAQLRGAEHSAPLLIDAPDTAALTAAVRGGDVAAIRELILESVDRLLGGGATELALCGAPGHLAAAQVAARAEAGGAGFLDMRSAVEARLTARGHHRLLLLDADWHPQVNVWSDWLAGRNFEIVRPARNHRVEVQRILTEELGPGRGTDASRQYLLALVQGEVGRRRADAVLLGAAELGVCLSGGELGVPLVDAAVVHAGALADRLAALEPALT